MKSKKNLELRFVVIFFVLAGVGLLIALASAILFSIGNDTASAVGVSSTILSIVLSVVSMVYTYISGIQTLKTIKEIKQQNDALVNEIANNRSEDNYNEISEEKAFT